MRRFALPILIAFNAAMLFGLAWLWLTPDGGLRNMRWQAPEPVKADLQSLLPHLPGQVQADTSQFLGMLERPLFSPTRRPPPPPPPPKAEVPEPVNRFAQAKLTGLFEGEGVGGVIINYDGKDRRVPLNGTLDGWKLQSVSGAQAVFAQAGQTRSVPLQRATLLTGPGPQQGRPTAPPAPGPGGAAAAPVQAPLTGGGVKSSAPSVARRSSFGGR